MDELKDYTLNKKRALDKKAVACDRIKFQIEPRDGGNQTVIECNTGMYEVLRSCIEKYYSEISKVHAIGEADQKVERNSLSVESVMKICNRKVRGEIYHQPVSYHLQDSCQWEGS